TRELVARAPRVEDEVKSALYYYRRSLLDAVPRLMIDMDAALENAYGAAAEEGPLPSVLRIRSWIGGDRDGNPNVTPEAMERAYRLQAEVALDAYLADVDGLVQRPSQWHERIELPREFAERLAVLER